MNKKNLFLCLSVLLSASSCKVQSEDKPDIVKKDFDFAGKQLEYAQPEIVYAIAHEPKASKAKRLKNNRGDLVSPRTVEKDGSLQMAPSKDWTSGFFPGELWYMYEYTKDAKWEQLARQFTAPIEREKTNATTHDMGFKVYCSFGNGYRLTKDEKYREILLQSAYTLTSRYKSKAGIIRSWNHSGDKWGCPVIIDNMMNLELLYWAFAESKDSLFYRVATTHAETTMKNHFRLDYSSYHVLDYDTITGEVLKKNTHQGYAHESAWARGQAWGLYGFTMCYRETGKPEFLEQAKHIARFIFTHPNLPSDLIPYWDYNAPEIPNEPRDASAATVTASALLELSMYDKENAAKYNDWANTILRNLSENYLAKQGGDRGFLLLHSTGTKPTDTEVDVPLSYADYYFLEALLRKQKLDQTGNVF
jgi:rhamnogalacturonyl hydrolase YesR